MTDHLIAPHGGTLIDLLVDDERVDHATAAELTLDTVAVGDRSGLGVESRLAYFISTCITIG